ncbi:MAG: nucleotidyltransferase family protein [Burkholderiaceae bacterium]|nr:nucleotidyltransferase family protein [Burkholderiaceae bacterium]
MSALRAVRELDLPCWCIGAGAVRNLVWDALHHHTPPSALPDVDVAYFDAVSISADRDSAMQARLGVFGPGVPWEVTNQAGVHLWYESHFGHRVEPLQSLEQAVASWPEFATCVGVRLESNNVLTVIAPHGLDDVFSMIIRRNPARASVEAYRQRGASKRYAQRWPKVWVVPC